MTSTLISNNNHIHKLRFELPYMEYNFAEYDFEYDFTENIHKFFDALKSNTSLTHLDWHGNNYFIEEIFKVSHLVYLNLSHCSTIDTQAKVIAEALKDNTSLTHLDLGSLWTEEEESGLKTLAEALKFNET